MEKIFFSGFLGSIYIFLFGVNEVNLKALNILFYIIIIDFILGIVKAFKTKKFKRQNFFEGIFNKVAEIFIVSLAFQVDKIGFLKGVADLQLITIYSYLVYELISIITKLRFFNIFIPKEFCKIEDLKEGDKNV